MKIESWDINQSSSRMLDFTVRTEVSFVTNDDVDRDTLLEHIKLYDRSTPIDLDFYRRMKKFAEEDEKLHDFYRGKSPEQIKEICDEIYERIHERVGNNIRFVSPQVDWDYHKLSVGIEILRAYDIWWTPSVAKEVENYDSESVEKDS